MFTFLRKRKLVEVKFDAQGDGGLVVDNDLNRYVSWDDERVAVKVRTELKAVGATHVLKTGDEGGDEEMPVDEFMRYVEALAKGFR